MDKQTPISNRDWLVFVQYLIKANSFFAINPISKQPWTSRNPRLSCDVAQCLQDGVFLCTFIYKLCPNTFPAKDFSHNPTGSPYLSKANINLFLKLCSSEFGYSEKDLFSAEDLLFGKNLHKVLSTLSKLSQTERSKQINGPAFSISCAPPPIPARASLHETSAGSLSFPSSPCPNINYYSNGNYDQDDDIYYRYMDIHKPETEGDNRLNELLMTEQDYVTHLEAVIEHFKKPLSRQLSESDINVIFFKIEDLLQVHVMFAEKLQRAAEDDSRMSAAECFISSKNSFLIYGDFCSNVERARKKIQQLLLRENHRLAIEECQKSYRKGNTSLTDLLVIPVQRVLKYPLFLKAFLEKTKESSAQWHSMRKAYEDVLDLADYVNEVKRDNEMLHNIEQIRKSITDCDFGMVKDLSIQPKDYRSYGRLIKDGEVKIKANLTSVPCVVFLFDHVLLLCRKAKLDTLSIHQLHETKDLCVEEVSSQERVLLVRSGQASFSLMTRSKQERRGWSEAFEYVRKLLYPKQNQGSPFNFSLHTFPTPSICDECRKLLKGVLSQGYYCPETKTKIHITCNPTGLTINEVPEKGRRTSRAVRDSIRNTEQTSARLSSLEELSVETWFAGEMDAKGAEGVLEGMPDGSFLVRSRPHAGGFRLGVKYKRPEKIQITMLEDQYSIDRVTPFASVQDLITCYENLSLDQSYSMINTKLLYPFKSVLAIARDSGCRNLVLCRVLHEYVPEKEEGNQLELKKGSIIQVLNTDVGQLGWWQGRFRDKVGYFPCRFVEYTFYSE